MPKSKPTRKRRTASSSQHLESDRLLARLEQQGDGAGLAAQCRQRLARDAGDRLGHRYLGRALQMAGRHREAHSAYEAALTRHPDDPQILLDFSQFLLTVRTSPEQALPHVERASRLRPDLFTAWFFKAICFQYLWRHQEGLEASSAALIQAKGSTERAAALNMRAVHLRELGRLDEALSDCREAIALNPDDLGFRGNHLLFLLSKPGLTPGQLYEAALAEGRAIESAIPPGLIAAGGASPMPRDGAKRRLRVGFLSPDFRVHAVMHFLEPLLARLDRSHFEVWSLYLIRQDDQVTERARQLSDHFVSLAGLSVEDSVHKLRSLDLDIVIDVAGHTAFNGLTILAAQVAPVQVSWLGYPATTGMKSIQHRFTDPVSDPPGADRWYTEKLYRMDGYFCCYRPMIRRPLLRFQEKYEVQPTPALRQGFITFGSCNNLGKITDEVLGLWAQVLQRVPDSRLLIEGKDLDKDGFAAEFKARCSKAGLPEERLILVALNPDNQYLTYHRIDIALDPFPFAGGTTSCDTLWMGVPLVTLAGELFSCRMGTGLLTVMGRSEWIAQDTGQYVDIAADLASDVQRLNGIRQTVRPAMERSPAMDEARFAQEFGLGLQTMWRQWVASRPAQGAPLRGGLAAALADHDAATVPAPALPPQDNDGVRPEIQVMMDLGRMSLSQAYAELQRGLERALASRPSPLPLRHDMLKPEWRAVTDDARLLMATLPEDPMALAVMAEVELAHGNSEAAAHYTQWATRTLASHEALR